MSDQATQGRLSPFLRRRRLEAARPWLRGKVFDFGCGSGALAGLVEADDYCGFDTDATSLARARASHPRHRFVDAPPEGAAFDTVVSLAVIEHCKDPAEFLRGLVALARPGARVVVTTPHPAFEFIHDLGARAGLFSHDASEEHEALLDRKALHDLASAQGLPVLAYRRFLFGANQLFVLQRP
ncbi:MAG TPA: class I SAM-dependent methyltransferase [Dokdonella sp.]